MDAEGVGDFPDRFSFFEQPLREFALICIHLLWAARLNAQDLRGITPLIYSHINPYGSFLLDLHSRLPIDPPRFGPQAVGTQMLLGYDQLTA